MNPAIVIPSFWTEGEQPDGLGEPGVYDYATPIAKPLPELETCLASLEQVRGLLRVIVLVIAPGCAEGARARVESICRTHPNLNPVVIGSTEAGLISETVMGIAPKEAGETAGLRGYGAIRNLGLAVAAILGHDVVVFMEDDEVVLDENFLVDGVFGLGQLNRQGQAIYAKSGYFLDSEGADRPRRPLAWSERYWSKAVEFGKVMQRHQDAVRFSRSNHMCGGCCAIHAAAFTKVPFDPYITRGEDLDYVLDLRAFGMDVWFDNAWSVLWQPPAETASGPSLFMQDTYRWLYEYRKLAALNSRRDLRTITTESLMPYPAPWLSEGVRKRIFKTAFRRMVAGPYRKEYLRILTRGRHEADSYAQEASSRYLSFAMAWPGIMSSLWGDERLAEKILSTGMVQPVLPRITSTSFDDDGFERGLL